MTENVDITKAVIVKDPAALKIIANAMKPKLAVQRIVGVSVVKILK